MILLDIAPLLSAYIIVGFVELRPISLKNFDNHIAWAVAHEKAIYSASTVDNATVSCHLHSQETGPPATMKIDPSVERLESLHPAKSEFT